MKRELIAGGVALAGGLAAALAVNYLVDEYDLRSTADGVATAPAVSSEPAIGMEESASHTPSQSQASATKDPARPAKKPPKGVPGPPKNAQPMRLTWVYDGDTIQAQAYKPGTHVNIEAKIDIRLIGVDAPELKPKKECYSLKATNWLKKFLSVGTRILIAPDRNSWDDYGRRLFNVWRAKDAALVEYQLANRGYAPAIRIWPNVKYYDVLKKAEQRAIKYKRGMWGAC